MSAYMPRASYKSVKAHNKNVTYDTCNLLAIVSYNIMPR